MLVCLKITRRYHFKWSRLFDNNGVICIKGEGTISLHQKVGDATIRNSFMLWQHLDKISNGKHAPILTVIVFHTSCIIPHAVCVYSKYRLVLFSLSSSDFSFSSVDPHTVSAARHWITSWWGVCLLRAGYEFFIFMPSKFPSFPCSPNYLLFHASFFLFIFFTLVCLSPPNIFSFSPRCSGFISLFRDRETILHARLELKQLSRFQANTETEVCLCVCLNMRYFEFLKFKRHFTEKKKKHDTISP